MEIGRFVSQFTCSLIGVLALAGLSPSPAFAQHDPTHALTSASGLKNTSSALVKLVRESTDRFRDVAVAELEEYQPLFGCVSGDDGGAMGMHFAKLDLVFDDVLDPTRPEIVIYEPRPDGSLRLIGADYLILADVWHAKNPPNVTPQIMGQLMHLFESPNRFGLPAFYTLHVWAWKDNPNGAFVNWHPKVSCDGYSGNH
jgi:hypothetical protein